MAKHKSSKRKAQLEPPTTRATSISTIRPAPPVPPRWMNPGGYSNGHGCWDVEREYNQLLTASGIRVALRRAWMRFTYYRIHVWTITERLQIEEATANGEI